MIDEMKLVEAVQEIIDGKEIKNKSFFNCKITPRLARLMESERKTEETLRQFRHKPYQTRGGINEDKEDIL